MKVAIVYDRVNKWGGAERDLLALHELFPDAPLYTAVYSPQKASWAKVFPEVIPSFLQKISFLRDKHELLGTFTPIAFEALDFSGYDLVISVTSEAAKGIIVRPPTVHICYCLTPTRYLWSGYDFYFQNPVLKFISRRVVAYLRAWDKIASLRPDVMIAQSRAVCARIKKYYDRDSEIIYPPVELETFLLKKGEEVKKENYFMLVSRLVPYKRADLAVEAFNKLGAPLVVIGIGSEAKNLKLKAKENIKFLGLVSDEKLAEYYKKAAALIFPQEEDFGLVAVEAQAGGTPVIAYKAGGALDTVIDPVKAKLTGQAATGLFFEKQTVESLVDAVKRFKKMRFNPEEAVKNAQRFSKEKFKGKFLEVVKKYSS